MVVYKTGEQTIYYGRFICLTITGTKIQRILSKLQRLRTMRAAALLWPGVPSTLSDPFCSERKRNVSGCLLYTSIMGIDQNIQKVVKGLVLLAAVIFDVVSKRKSFIVK